MANRLYCPTCFRDDFKSLQGLSSHINSITACRLGFRHHRKQRRPHQTRSKSSSPAPAPTTNDSVQEEDTCSHAPNEVMDEQEGIMEVVADWDAQDEEAFHFIDALVEEEEEMVEIGVAGPGPSTQDHRRQNKKFWVYALDEEDDTRIKVLHKTAGKVIKMKSSLHEQWRMLFQNDHMDVDQLSSGSQNPYSPFASELDWRVARWAIKDGIGHKSLDRLLAIPGVSIF